MKYRGIEIAQSKKEAPIFFTEGLFGLIGSELQILHNDDDEGTIRLVEYLIDYAVDHKPVIKNNETISYGLWLLKFVEESKFLKIFELNDSFQAWVEGAQNAIYYLELQRKTCISENTDFKQPQFLQKIAISKGVLDGLAVQGIRYNEPEHMSGWYLTTNLYDGKISSMKVIPLQELVVARKDLIEFLALPPSYVFQTFDDHSCQIWRISDMANDLRSN